MTELLDRAGYRYRRVGGACMCVMEGGLAKWQCAFCQGDSGVLIYSVYPFEARGGAALLARCNSVNALLPDGCFYVEAGRARVVLRSRVDLSDGFYALELFQRAMELHCSLFLQYWGDIQEAAQGGG